MLASCQAVAVAKVSATQSVVKRAALGWSSELTCSAPPSCSVKIYSARWGLAVACS